MGCDVGKGLQDVGDFVLEAGRSIVVPIAGAALTGRPSGYASLPPGSSGYSPQPTPVYRGPTTGTNTIMIAGGVVLAAIVVGMIVTRPK